MLGGSTLRGGKEGSAQYLTRSRKGGRGRMFIPEKSSGFDMSGNCSRKGKSASEKKEDLSISWTGLF